MVWMLWTGTCWHLSQRDQWVDWEVVGRSCAAGKNYDDVYPRAARSQKFWLEPLEPKAREKLCAVELPAAHARVRCALKTPQLISLYDVFRSPPTKSGTFEPQGFS